MSTRVKVLQNYTTLAFIIFFGWGLWKGHISTLVDWLGIGFLAAGLCYGWSMRFWIESERIKASTELKGPVSLLLFKGVTEGQRPLSKKH